MEKGISHHARGFSGRQPLRYCHVTTDNWRVNCISFIGVQLNIYTVCIFQHKQRGFSRFSFLLSLFLLLSLLLQIYVQDAQAGSKWLDVEENEENTSFREYICFISILVCNSHSGIPLQIHPAAFLHFWTTHICTNTHTHTHK